MTAIIGPAACSARASYNPGRVISRNRDRVTSRKRRRNMPPH